MGGRRWFLVLLTLTLLCAPVNWPELGWAAPTPVPLPAVADADRPDPATLPGGANPASAGARQIYEYVNRAEELRNRPQPQQFEIELARVSPQAAVPGTWEHCLRRWFEYQQDRAAKLAEYQSNPVGAAPVPLPWDKWLRRYIPNMGNDNQGKAFVLHVADRLGLGSNHGWRSEVEVPEAGRHYDLANLKLGLFYEVKSGAGIEMDQYRKDSAFVAAERGKAEPRRLVYLFPREPTKRAKALLQEAGIPYYVVPAQKKAIGPGGPAPDPGGPGPAVGRDTRGAPVGEFRDSTTSAGDILRAPDQHQVSDAAPEEVAQSGNTPEETAELRRVQRQFAEESGHPDLAEDELGGVDFSTLQLRYVSDTYHHGSGVQYAFTAGALADDQTSFGGQRAARLASDSFFVWLVLPPSAFTVNLNPDEPERIIDDRFGKTDAGRVLLEADLAMKKEVAEFIHPDTPGGQQFWAALGGDKCLSIRQWIVPDTATVRDSGDELFILDAPLLVKMEGDVFKTKGVLGEGCAAQGEAVTRSNENVFRTMILPQVQNAINHAPEYADLRRVYTSRVAAEWFRQRSATRPTAYSDLIDTGDIGRWTSRENWSPREVFDRYVHSFKNGEFNLTRTTAAGDYLYIYGGVDFTRVNRKGLGADAFAGRHPTRAAAVRDAVYGPVDEGKQVWLGGRTTAVPPSEAFVKPAPATSNPVFWALAALPVIIWLMVGGALWRRRLAPVRT